MQTVAFVKKAYRGVLQNDHVRKASAQFPIRPFLNYRFKHLVFAYVRKVFSQVQFRDFITS